MELALDVVTAAGVVGSTAMLALVGVQLGRIRTELRRGLRVIPETAGPSHLATVESPGGHAIYVFRRDRWELEADFSKPGFEPSPPHMQGAYEGQAIKRQSVEQQDRR